MARIRKVLLFIVLLIGVSSSLMAIKQVRCDSITNPPSPEFTIRFVQEANNNTIVLTVTNQPINNPVNGEYYYHYYDVRWKNHSESENAWKWLYPDQVTQTVTLPYPSASNSQFTELSYSANIFSPNSQLDYQIQIIVATDVHVFSSQNFTDGQWEKQVIGQSVWSTTQTITIPASSNSTATTPTVPEFPTSILVVSFLLAATLLATIMVKRKQSKGWTV